LCGSKIRSMFYPNKLFHVIVPFGMHFPLCMTTFFCFLCARMCPRFHTGFSDLWLLRPFLMIWSVIVAHRKLSFQILQDPYESGLGTCFSGTPVEPPHLLFFLRHPMLGRSHPRARAEPLLIPWLRPTKDACSRFFKPPGGVVTPKKSPFWGWGRTKGD